MGNLVFLHERATSFLLDDVLACASSLALQSLRVGKMYAAAAADRLELIERLDAKKRAKGIF